MDGFNVWSGVNISNFSQIGQEMAKLAFSLFVAYSYKLKGYIMGFSSI